MEVAPIVTNFPVGSILAERRAHHKRGQAFADKQLDGLGEGVDRKIDVLARLRPKGSIPIGRLGALPLLNQRSIPRMHPTWRPITVATFRVASHRQCDAFSGVAIDGDFFHEGIEER